MPVFIRRNSNNLPHNDHLLFFCGLFPHYTTLYSIDTKELTRFPYVYLVIVRLTIT
ncbi:hypothetical protein BDB01DRAFT_800228 [Pilobolus umbonatus]|nr:hypothetical protein BDB01DRAFT_800228 [Pilobolus umbonatus]